MGLKKNPIPTYGWPDSDVRYPWFRFGTRNVHQDSVHAPNRNIVMGQDNVGCRESDRAASFVPMGDLSVNCIWITQERLSGVEVVLLEHVPNSRATDPLVSNQVGVDSADTEIPLLPEFT